MGKSEILMLLAGVALSVMLAMIAVPMFSSGNEMADRQQVQQDLMSIKSSIPLILALEGNKKDNFNPENIEKHVTGFEKHTTKTGTIINSKSTKKTEYKIKDGDIGGVVEIEVQTPDKAFNLQKLSRLESICDGHGVDAVTNEPLKPTVSEDKLTCKIKR